MPLPSPLLLPLPFPLPSPNMLKISKNIHLDNFEVPLPGFKIRNIHHLIKYIYNKHVSDETKK